MPRAAKWELPPADTIRWSFLRKAAVVRGIRAGTISRQHACDLYRMSSEELEEWEKAFDQEAGPYGLLVKKRRNKSSDQSNSSHEID
jgi:hypothetical protein